MHGQECINCVSLTAGLDYDVYSWALDDNSDERGICLCVALCLFSGWFFSYLFSLIYFYDIDSPTFKSPLLCIFFADKAKKAIITLIIHVTLLLLLTGNYLSENKSMFNVRCLWIWLYTEALLWSPFSRGFAISCYW